MIIIYIYTFFKEIMLLLGSLMILSNYMIKHTMLMITNEYIVILGFGD